MEMGMLRKSRTISGCLCSCIIKTCLVNQ
uniref:Uncharacterized protein n=1 Tax=Arundo donax TaxID=35708 RepID=A0A0A9A341_ARUDO